MPSLPRLSVVIAARDALRWLPGALASVGSRPDIEILVVDDASTDGTWDFLVAVARCNPRIRPLRGAGGGPAEARNLALNAAVAPLIAFLDADDRWRPGKLERQLELHRLHAEIGFSFTDHRRQSEEAGPLPGGFARCPRFAARHAMRREAFVLDADAQAQLYAEPVVATSTVVARTALLRAVGGFNEQLARSEDWDLWLHLAACAPVGCVPQPLAERWVPAFGPDAAEAALRRTARRRVALAYAAPAAALDPAAPALCRIGLLRQDAETAAIGGQPLRAALLRLGAVAASWADAAASRVFARAPLPTSWRDDPAPPVEPAPTAVETAKM